MLFGKMILIDFYSALSTLSSDAAATLTQIGQHIAPKIGLCLAGTFILGSLCFANDETLGIFAVDADGVERNIAHGIFGIGREEGDLGAIGAPDGPNNMEFVG